ncbi:hypothetical protein BJV74DRAFT_882338 [Russula compacta]|nr:hypothetical protein BJV74DRAFT_882338 [Russula compacta]
MAKIGTSEDWEPHKRLLFLAEEEDYEEIGLSDGEEISIDVLQTAECDLSIQGGSRELPNNYPFIVQRGYIIDSVGRWDSPAKTLFNFTVEKLKTMILRISRESNAVVNTVIKYLDERAKETSTLVEFLLGVEKGPSTANAHYFKDYRRKFFAFDRGIFNSDSNSSFIERLQGRKHQSTEFSRALESVLLNLPRIGFRDVKPLELALLQVSGDDAIKIMADVHADFQVAYKRFVDNVPKAIDRQLVLGIAKGLRYALATGLGVDSQDAHERCAKLLAEAPRIAEKREKLLMCRKRLSPAKDELLNVFD